MGSAASHVSQYNERNASQRSTGLPNDLIQWHSNDNQNTEITDIQVVLNKEFSRTKS